MYRFVCGISLLTFLGVVMIAPQVIRTRLSIPEVPQEGLRFGREIYPFSIVPGGVFTAEEARISISADPVVAEHYQEIDPDRLMRSRLREPIEAHVSYRVQDRVYWTQDNIRISAGELVLTDGRHLIRARCGNLIARELPAPSLLGAPSADPPELTFVTPFPGLVPQKYPPLIVGPPSDKETDFVASGRRDTRSPGPLVIPLPLPPLGCAGCAPFGGEHFSERPPAPVPEPQTWLLLVSGLLMAVGARNRRFSPHCDRPTGLKSDS